MNEKDREISTSNTEVVALRERELQLKSEITTLEQNISSLLSSKESFASLEQQAISLYKGCS